MQSAYRPKHSVETALLNDYNDVLVAIDNGMEAALILLDLSAAFDTIDHHILITRLHCRCGLSGTTLRWIESYLSNRRQSVRIGGCSSQPHPLRYGVPQGSVLGPVLFTIYTAPLGELIRSHGLDFVVLYADDTQIFMSVRDDSPAKISSLEACLDDIKFWMQCNKLQLNDEKN